MNVAEDLIDQISNLFVQEEQVPENGDASQPGNRFSPREIETPTFHPMGRGEEPTLPSTRLPDRSTTFPPDSSPLSPSGQLPIAESPPPSASGSSRPISPFQQPIADRVEETIVQTSASKVSGAGVPSSLESELIRMKGMEMKELIKTLSKGTERTEEETKVWRESVGKLVLETLQKEVFGDKSP